MFVATVADTATVAGQNAPPPEKSYKNKTPLKHKANYQNDTPSRDATRALSNKLTGGRWTEQTDGRRDGHSTVTYTLLHILCEQR